jgi:hypothetical protein
MRLLAAHLLPALQKDVMHRVGRGGNKLPGVVLPLAAAKLATTFGLEMKEIKRHAGTAPARGAAAAAGRHVHGSQQMLPGSWCIKYMLQAMCSSSAAYKEARRSCCRFAHVPAAR